MERGRRAASGLVLVLVACAGGPAPDPLSYRLSGSGTHWDEVAGERVVDALALRYPDYFDIILDPGNTREPDLRPLRDDLEKDPVDAANYDALNAIAIGYLELNYRAGADPGGPTYFADSFRAAKLLAVPWRGYSEIDDGPLRDAILDFFEDAGTGGKLGTAATAPRLARIVASLEKKENDAARAGRIRELTARINALAGHEAEEP
jgi:hypothetical protein